ncbi:MAG: WYL domain-containing protein [Actinomycetota bacterium]|nr:WYL domain-containing protein [Actinomycetota bacterium]
MKFAPSIAKFISEVQWHPSQELVEDGDGSVVASFEVMGIEEIKRWILGFGSEVEVLEPEELGSRWYKGAEGIVGMYKV